MALPARLQAAVRLQPHRLRQLSGGDRPIIGQRPARPACSTLTQRWLHDTCMGDCCLCGTFNASLPGTALSSVCAGVLDLENRASTLEPPVGNERVEEIALKVRHRPL